jgi:hypothetical protein
MGCARHFHGWRGHFPGCRQKYILLTRLFGKYILQKYILLTRLLGKYILLTRLLDKYILPAAWSAVRELEPQRSHHREGARERELEETSEGSCVRELEETIEGSWSDARVRGRVSASSSVLF